MSGFVLEAIETSAGNRYEKRLDKNQNPYYYSPDTDGHWKVSARSWAAAKKNEERQIIDRGKGVEEAEREMPVPADNRRGYRYIDVNAFEQSKAGGEVKKYRDTDGDNADDTVVIQGEEYTVEELAEAFRKAKPQSPRGSVMRYL